MERQNSTAAADWRASNDFIFMIWNCPISGSESRTLETPPRVTSKTAERLTFCSGACRRTPTVTGGRKGERGLYRSRGLWATGSGEGRLHLLLQFRQELRPTLRIVGEIDRALEGLMDQGDTGLIPNRLQHPAHPLRGP